MENFHETQAERTPILNNLNNATDNEEYFF